jgi:hypothetical protein
LKGEKMEKILIDFQRREILVSPIQEKINNTKNGFTVDWPINPLVTGIRGILKLLDSKINEEFKNGVWKMYKNNKIEDEIIY